jgi:hypothetical protein
MVKLKWTEKEIIAINKINKMCAAVNLHLGGKLVSHRLPHLVNNFQWSTIIPFINMVDIPWLTISHLQDRK